MTDKKTNAELKKLIKDEPDTVRAAHLQRVLDGTKPLEALTIKSDEKRTKRDAMISALPAVAPVMPEDTGPNEPQLGDVNALQARVAELEAQLAQEAA